MAPSATDYPLDSPYHVRVAFDPEVGPNTGQNQPSQDVPSGDHPMLKHLTPRFKNLTPWPYVAVAAISLILLFVLGYALSNCYRRMKTCKPLDSGSASLQRIGLIERKGTIGRSGNSVGYVLFYTPTPAPVTDSGFIEKFFLVGREAELSRGGL